MTFFFLIFLSHPALQTQAYTGNVLCPPFSFIWFYLFIYFLLPRHFPKGLSQGSRDYRGKMKNSNFWVMRFCHSSEINKEWKWGPHGLSIGKKTNKVQGHIAYTSAFSEINQQTAKKCNFFFIRLDF